MHSAFEIIRCHKAVSNRIRVFKTNNALAIVLKNIYLFLQVKIWFQNRRSKAKKMIKQGANPMQASGQQTPTPVTSPTQGQPPMQPHSPSQQHSPQTPSAHSHNTHGHHPPNGLKMETPDQNQHNSVMISPASSVSPEHEPQWSDHPANNYTSSQSYMPMSNMPPMTSVMTSGMPPMSHYHPAWYSTQPMMNQQSCLTWTL